MRTLRKIVYDTFLGSARKKLREENFRLQQENLELLRQINDVYTQYADSCQKQLTTLNRANTIIANLRSQLEPSLN